MRDFQPQMLNNNKKASTSSKASQVFTMSRSVFILNPQTDTPRRDEGLVQMKIKKEPTIEPSSPQDHGPDQSSDKSSNNSRSGEYRGLKPNYSEMMSYFEGRNPDSQKNSDRKVAATLSLDEQQDDQFLNWQRMNCELGGDEEEEEKEDESSDEMKTEPLQDLSTIDRSSNLESTKLGRGNPCSIFTSPFKPKSTKSSFDETSRLKKKSPGRRLVDPPMERRLLDWIKETMALENRAEIERSRIQQQAIQFKTKGVTFSASKGWLEKFLLRNQEELKSYSRAFGFTKAQEETMIKFHDSLPEVFDFYLRSKKRAMKSDYSKFCSPVSKPFSPSKDSSSWKASELTGSHPQKRLKIKKITK